jgi:hypothetical protein
MKRIRNAVLVGLSIATSAAAAARVVMPEAPDPPDVKTRYIFYLHGKSIDEGSTSTLGPYGRTVEALAAQGFVVVSKARPAGKIRVFPADFEAYAGEIADQIKAMLKRGMPAAHIAVVRYSRCGTLTLMVSGLVANPGVKFAVLAGCIAPDGAYQRALPTMLKEYAPRLTGRVLSLRDDGDADFGSCESHMAMSSAVSAFDEIVLSTGKGHLAFLEPDSRWIEPLTEWVRRP